MIRVTVFRKDGHTSGLRAAGHAAYAEEGSDIICAAASALLTNAVNSVELLAGDPVEELETGEGLISCRFPAGLSDKGELLMQSLFLGLGQMEELRDPESDEPYLQLLFEEE